MKVLNTIQHHDIDNCIYNIVSLKRGDWGFQSIKDVQYGSKKGCHWISGYPASLGFICIICFNFVTENKAVADQVSNIETRWPFFTLLLTLTQTTKSEHTGFKTHTHTRTPDIQSQEKLRPSSLLTLVPSVQHFLEGAACHMPRWCISFGFDSWAA